MDLDFDGMAVGGLSVGETHEERVTILEHLAPELPKTLPHYLMGVGKPEDIVEAVYYGIDMFDCVLPTRNARNGQLITSFGELNIRNAEHKTSSEPIDPDCACKVCKIIREPTFIIWIKLKRFWDQFYRVITISFTIKL